MLFAGHEPEPLGTNLEPASLRRQQRVHSARSARARALVQDPQSVALDPSPVQRQFSGRKKLSLDEMTIAFKVRSTLKKYNPRKPDK